MKKLSISKINYKLLIILTIYTAICASIIRYYQLSFPVSILLFLSGGGIVVLVNPLLKPIIKYQEKKAIEKQSVIDKHMAIAKKSGKKAFAIGPEKLHTVWAQNNFEANKLYHLHIAPRITYNPTKAFYYISKNCNNTTK